MRPSLRGQPCSKRAARARPTNEARKQLKEAWTVRALAQANIDHNLLNGCVRSVEFVGSLRHIPCHRFAEADCPKVAEAGALHSLLQNRAGSIYASILEPIVGLAGVTVCNSLGKRADRVYAPCMNINEVIADLDEQIITLQAAVMDSSRPIATTP